MNIRYDEQIMKLINNFSVEYECDFYKILKQILNTIGINNDIEIISYVNKEKLSNNKMVLELLRDDIKSNGNNNAIELTLYNNDIEYTFLCDIDINNTTRITKKSIKKSFLHYEYEIRYPNYGIHINIFTCNYTDSIDIQGNNVKLNINKLENSLNNKENIEIEDFIEGPYTKIIQDRYETKVKKINRIKELPYTVNHFM